MRRWRFTEHVEGQVARWTWRLLAPDGSIEQTSTSLPSYGAAIRDALTNGFSPQRDHWIMDTPICVVHYERGQHIVVPKSEREDLPRTLADRRKPLGRARLSRYLGVDKRRPVKEDR